MKYNDIFIALIFCTQQDTQIVIGLHDLKWALNERFIQCNALSLRPKYMPLQEGELVQRQVMQPEAVYATLVIFTTVPLYHLLGGGTAVHLFNSGGYLQIFYYFSRLSIQSLWQHPLAFRYLSHAFEHSVWSLLCRGLDRLLGLPQSTRKTHPRPCCAVSLCFIFGR